MRGVPRPNPTFYLDKRAQTAVIPICLTQSISGLQGRLSKCIYFQRNCSNQGNHHLTQPQPPPQPSLAHTLTHLRHPAPLHQTPSHSPQETYPSLTHTLNSDPAQSMSYPGMDFYMTPPHSVLGQLSLCRQTWGVGCVYLGVCIQEAKGTTRRGSMSCHVKAVRRAVIIRERRHRSKARWQQAAVAHSRGH